MLGTPDDQHGPAPAAQPGFVVLGCLAPVGEPDVELQRLMPGEVRRDGHRTGQWTTCVSFDLDLDPGWEGQDLPGHDHEAA